MRQDEPSHTALQVAAARAAHVRFDAPPHLLEDRLAEALLGEEHAALIDLYRDGGHWMLRENRLFVPLRARWAEDRVLAAHARGVPHYVILGAGLDSFAFRQPPALRDLRILEVDHPATQRWKRARIEALGWAVPSNLTFVECDFEREAVTDALGRVGVGSGTLAAVSWMGVIFYLERATARAALAELHQLLAPGSELLLDYLHPYEDLAPRYQELSETLDVYLRQVGEPHVNKLRPEELAVDLLGAGFAQVIRVERDDLSARYLAGRHDDVPLSERLRLAVGIA